MHEALATTEPAVAEPQSSSPGCDETTSHPAVVFLLHMWDMMPSLRTMICAPWAFAAAACCAIFPSANACASSSGRSSAMGTWATAPV